MHNKIVPIISHNKNDRISNDLESFKVTTIDSFNESIDESFNILSKTRAISQETLYILKNIYKNQIAELYFSNSKSTPHFTTFTKDWNLGLAKALCNEFIAGHFCPSPDIVQSKASLALCQK